MHSVRLLGCGVKHGVNGNKFARACKGCIEDWLFEIEMEMCYMSLLKFVELFNGKFNLKFQFEVEVVNSSFKLFWERLYSYIFPGLTYSQSLKLSSGNNFIKLGHQFLNFKHSSTYVKLLLFWICKIRFYVTHMCPVSKYMFNQQIPELRQPNLNTWRPLLLFEIT